MGPRENKKKSLDKKFSSPLIICDKITSEILMGLSVVSYETGDTYYAECNHCSAKNTVHTLHHSHYKKPIPNQNSCTNSVNSICT